MAAVRSTLPSPDWSFRLRPEAREIQSLVRLYSSFSVIIGLFLNFSSSLSPELPIVCAKVHIGATFKGILTNKKIAVH